MKIDPAHITLDITRVMQDVTGIELTEDQKSAMCGALAVWLYRVNPFRPTELKYLLTCVERDPRTTLKSVQVVKEKLQRLVK